MDILEIVINFIKGNHGTWIQSIISGLFLNLKLWVYLFIFIYLLKISKRNLIGYIVKLVIVFLIIFEFININDRQNYEVVKYQFELIDKNTENLVIVIQGANSPVKDAVKDNQIQVDNTSSRDYYGLGSIERYVENSKTQVVTYVGTHTFNLTPIKIINMVNDFRLIKPNGKIIFEIPNAADPLYSVYDIESFERFYWSMAHHWYFNYKSLKFLLDKLGYRFEIQLEQRYDLSNHMVCARDGRPGGMGKFSDFLGKELEESYKKNLIKSGHCDTLIGIVYKGS